MVNLIPIANLSKYISKLETLSLFLPFRTAKPHPRLGVEMGGP